MSKDVTAILRAAMGSGPDDDSYIEDRVCVCVHADFWHSRGTCAGRDSYGLPCRCPSFELDDVLSVNPRGE